MSPRTPPNKMVAVAFLFSMKGFFFDKRFFKITELAAEKGNSFVGGNFLVAALAVLFQHIFVDAF